MVSVDKAIKVIRNGKITGNTDITDMKTPNSITKNATNFLIFNKKDQRKDKKRH